MKVKADIFHIIDQIKVQRVFLFIAHAFYLNGARVTQTSNFNPHIFATQCRRT